MNVERSLKVIDKSEMEAMNFRISIKYITSYLTELAINKCLVVVISIYR